MRSLRWFAGGLLLGVVAVAGCGSPKMPEGPPPEYEPPRAAPSPPPAVSGAPARPAPSGGPAQLPPIDDD